MRADVLFSRTMNTAKNIYIFHPNKTILTKSVVYNAVRIL